jgi:phenylalanyl-tRNA synthetase beta chain
MRAARARKVIGVPVTSEEMAEIFRRLGLEASREGVGDKEVFVVTPPSYRFDIEIEEDLIEEVARIYGFERIPVRPPVAAAVMSVAGERHRSLHDLRRKLAAAEYQEVVNYSFVEASWESDLAGNGLPIKLLNPIASHLSVMRSTLVGGLLENVRYNLNRKLERVRVFEIGRAFLRDPGVRDGDLDVGGIRQPVRIAALAYGSAMAEQWGEPSRPVDFFDVKSDLQNLIAPLAARFEATGHPALHPGRSARVLVEGREIGFIGELHPKWRTKYAVPGPAVLFEVDAGPLQTLGLPGYREVSKYPPVRRDLAVTVDETTPAQAMLDALMLARPAIVENIAVFDVYRGKNIDAGKKGLAFRVLLQDTQKTLTDAEVDAATAGLLKVLEQEFGAKLRQ